MANERIECEADIIEWKLARVPNKLSSHWGQSIPLQLTLLSLSHTQWTSVRG
jgi:hypothetical protein